MNPQEIDQLLPEEIKTAFNDHEAYKVAAARTGLKEFSLEKIACYLGQKVAERKLKFGSIGRGLIALQKLTQL